MKTQKQINFKLLVVLLLTSLTFTNATAQLDSTYFEVLTKENGDPMYF